MPILERPSLPGLPPLLWVSGSPDRLTGDVFLGGSIFEGGMGPWASGGWAVVALSRGARALRE
eukprot:6438865-Pyramimonas_sp.AAC.1